MPLAEITLSKVAEEVFKYILKKGIESSDGRLKEKLGLEPTRRAFKQALGKAFEGFEKQYPETVAEFFDVSFLEKEAAPVLAQFLLPDGHPDASDLATRWADSLNIRGEGNRTILIREMEPVAVSFLELFAHQLKAKSALREINDSRAFDRMSDDLGAIREALKTDRATPGTRWDYLHWLIERNLYLRASGTFQTRRMVQVRLEDVYVSLRAQREYTALEADRRLEQELAELDAKISAGRLAGEDAEDRREQLMARYTSKAAFESTSGEVLELSMVVTRHEKLVVLGDPGSGKSTLLRYLALKHAQALWNGQADVGSNLGVARFPIFIRIADYVESQNWKDKPLSDFLSGYCISHACPKPGLDDLLRKELTPGNCLVLLDGLDEIVSADDRRAVVQKIEEFIRVHDNVPNRFVVTSRIAGYRSAPLAGPAIHRSAPLTGPVEETAAHFTIQDMDLEQIRSFLVQWCPAVEEFETLGLSPEAMQAKAQAEIDGIMKAVETTPGVKRLAANPLLLRTLALIHHTGAQLPQKRIELYKLAADTLARTWRIAQLVPEMALVQEEYLTPLLNKFAYWLHVNKPTGIATEQEVHDVLGEEWARMKHLTWNPNDPDPQIKGEVTKFLLQVREHTGLFVERAPRRYGFMHLTFEEYYIARHLVARSSTRAELIRKHLHDPRWDEPILLGLGFVGLDYSEDAAELLETAIYQPEGAAKELGFTPNQYENLLGQDYLFALRCLGDQVPATKFLISKVVERLADEILHKTGSARFNRYRNTLYERLDYLRGSEAASELVKSFLACLSDPNQDTGVRMQAADGLGRLGQAPPNVVDMLLSALTDPDPLLRIKAAESLGRLDQASSDLVQKVVRELLSTLSNKYEDTNVRIKAAESLGRLGQTSPEVVSLDDIVEEFLSALIDQDPDMRKQAANSLERLRQASPKVVQKLLSVLTDQDDIQIRIRVVDSLGRLVQASPEAIKALLWVLDRDQPARITAVYSLGRLGQASPEVGQGLLSVLHDQNPKVREAVAYSLGRLGQASLEVMQGLLVALKDKDRDVRIRAAESLGWLGQASPEVVQGLLFTLKDEKENSTVRIKAAESLGRLGQASSDVVQELLTALGDQATGGDYAVISLGWLGQASPDVVDMLLSALRNPEAEIRYRAAKSLERLRQASPEVVQGLLVALDDPIPEVRSTAALCLGRLGEDSTKVVQELLDAVNSGVTWPLDRDAANLLGLIGQDDDHTIKTLLDKLLNKEHYDVRATCAGALAHLALRFPRSKEKIADKLKQAIENPDFEALDNAQRAAYDYAFDSLSMLAAGVVDEN